MAPPSLAHEIECYSLPYGLLGFISHLLTYWTLGCLFNGRSPLWPWRKPTSGRVSILLSSLSLLLTFIMAVITLVKCKNRWQLQAIGVWKLSMSFLNGCTSLQYAVDTIRKSSRVRPREVTPKNDVEQLAGRSIWDREVAANTTNDLGIVQQQPTVLDQTNPSVLPIKTRNVGKRVEANNQPIKKEEREPKGQLAWIALYVPGNIAGFVGLLSLVKQNYHHRGVKPLTACFGVVYGLGSIFGLINLIKEGSEGRSDHGKQSDLRKFLQYSSFYSCLSILSVFYSDWVLGIVAEKPIGFPSKDNSPFFWTYWIAKRLTMVAW